MLVAGDGIHTTFCECAPLRTKCLLILRTYVPHPWLLKAENPLEMVNEKRNTEQLFWPRQSIFLAPSPISCPKRWYKLYGDVDLRRDKKLGQQICLLFLLHIVPSVCRSRSSSGPPSSTKVYSLQFLPRIGSVAHFHPSLSLNPRHQFP